MSKKKMKKAATEAEPVAAIDEQGQIDHIAEPDASKKKVAAAAVAAIAAMGIGIGIGLLVNRKLCLGGTSEACVNHAANAVAVTAKKVSVDSFLRKLPEKWNASDNAKAYAASLGVKLAENQTIVRPQVRHYGKVA